MSTFITVIHVIVCVFLMLTVLLQSGKGGGMGAAFGGGNTGTVFGGSGASQFLRRLTVGAAVIFMITSMLLAYLASQSSEDALRAFSASQRRQRELKEKLREEALEGVTPEAPDGEGGDLVPDDDADEPPTGGEGEVPPASDAPDKAAPADEDKKLEDKEKAKADPGKTPGAAKPAADAVKPTATPARPAAPTPTP